MKVFLVDDEEPSRERLKELLTDIAAELPTEIAGEARNGLDAAERHRIALVPVRDILFLRAEQKYVTVRTREREHLIEESLTALEREFAERFVRIHRNCLVARAAIRGFERSSGDDEAHWLVVID